MPKKGRKNSLNKVVPFPEHTEIGTDSLETSKCTAYQSLCNSKDFFH